MPGLPGDFAALRVRANSSFNYLLRKPNEPDTTHAKARQEAISEDQLMEMRNILMALHAVWQPFKDLPADDVDRQLVFELIDFCYRCFCYAWMGRSANYKIYGSGMVQMKAEFSPALNDALQRHYPAAFFSAAPDSLSGRSSVVRVDYSMSCER